MNVDAEVAINSVDSLLAELIELEELDLAHELFEIAEHWYHSPEQYAHDLSMLMSSVKERLALKRETVR